MNTQKSLKLRLGLISPQREDLLKIKENFPDVTIVHAKNIIEFIPIAGNNRIDAIIFLDQGNLGAEMRNIHSFLRSKSVMSKIPCLILSEKEDFAIDHLILDTNLRFYNSRGGVFLPVLNFLTAVQDQISAKNILNHDQIYSSFSKALTIRLGQGSEFSHRPATEDELRSSFFCQKSDEISSNLIWVKFVARILNDKSKGLKEMFSSFTEEEIEETTEKILSTAFDEFKVELKKSAQEQGALFLPSIDNLKPADRSVLIKQGRSTAVLFESSVCCVVLEEIRYI